MFPCIATRLRYATPRQAESTEDTEKKGYFDRNAVEKSLFSSDVFGSGVQLICRYTYA
jgi:hypothetical protein